MMGVDVNIVDRSTISVGIAASERMTFLGGTANGLIYNAHL